MNCGITHGSEMGSREEPEGKLARRNSEGLGGTRRERVPRGRNEWRYYEGRSGFCYCERLSGSFGTPPIWFCWRILASGHRAQLLEGGQPRTGKPISR